MIMLRTLSLEWRMSKFHSNLKAVLGFIKYSNDGLLPNRTGNNPEGKRPGGFLLHYLRHFLRH